MAAAEVLRQLEEPDSIIDQSGLAHVVGPLVDLPATIQVMEACLKSPDWSIANIQDVFRTLSDRGLLEFHISGDRRSVRGFHILKRCLVFNQSHKDEGEIVLQALGRSFDIQEPKTEESIVLAGREIHMEKIHEAIVNAEQTLIQIAGPTGSGKSKICIEVLKSLDDSTCIDCRNTANARDLKRSIALAWNIVDLTGDIDNVFAEAVLNRKRMPVIVLENVDAIVKDPDFLEVVSVLVENCYKALLFTVKQKAELPFASDELSAQLVEVSLKSLDIRDCRQIIYSWGGFQSNVVQDDLLSRLSKSPLLLHQLRGLLLDKKRGRIAAKVTQEISIKDDTGFQTVFFDNILEEPLKVALVKLKWFATEFDYYDASAVLDVDVKVASLILDMLHHYHFLQLKKFSSKTGGKYFLHENVRSVVEVRSTDFLKAVEDSRRRFTNHYLDYFTKLAKNIDANFIDVNVEFCSQIPNFEVAQKILLDLEDYPESFHWVMQEMKPILEVAYELPRRKEIVSHWEALAYSNGNLLGCSLFCCMNVMAFLKLDGYDSALNQLEKARDFLKEFESKTRLSTKDTKGFESCLAFWNYCKGILLTSDTEDISDKKLQEALQHLEAATASRELLKSQSELAKCYNELGSVHFKLKHHKEATYFLNKSCFVRKMLSGDMYHPDYVISLQNLAAAIQQFALANTRELNHDVIKEFYCYADSIKYDSCYLRKRTLLEEALWQLMCAFKIAVKVWDGKVSLPVVKILRNMANVCLHLEAWNEALWFGLNGLHRGKFLDIPSSKGIIVSLCYLVYKAYILSTKLHDSSKALSYLRDGFEIGKSIAKGKKPVILGLMYDELRKQGVKVNDPFETVETEITFKSSLMSLLEKLVKAPDAALIIEDVCRRLKIFPPYMAGNTLKTRKVKTYLEKMYEKSSRKGDWQNILDTAFIQKVDNGRWSRDFREISRFLSINIDDGDSMADNVQIVWPSIFTEVDIDPLERQLLVECSSVIEDITWRWQNISIRKALCKPEKWPSIFTEVDIDSLERQLLVLLEADRAHSWEQDTVSTLLGELASKLTDLISIMDINSTSNYAAMKLGWQLQKELYTRDMLILMRSMVQQCQKRNIGVPLWMLKILMISCDILDFRHLPFESIWKDRMEEWNNEATTDTWLAFLPKVDGLKSVRQARLDKDFPSRSFEDLGITISLIDAPEAEIPSLVTVYPLPLTTLPNFEFFTIFVSEVVNIITDFPLSSMLKLSFTAPDSLLENVQKQNLQLVIKQLSGLKHENLEVTHWKGKDGMVHVTAEVPCDGTYVLVTEPQTRQFTVKGKDRVCLYTERGSEVFLTSPHAEEDFELKGSVQVYFFASDEMKDNHYPIVHVGINPELEVVLNRPLMLEVVSAQHGMCDSYEVALYKCEEWVDVTRQVNPHNDEQRKVTIMSLYHFSGYLLFGTGVVAGIVGACVLPRLARRITEKTYRPYFIVYGKTSYEDSDTDTFRIVCTEERFSKWWTDQQVRSRFHEIASSSPIRNFSRDDIFEFSYKHGEIAVFFKEQLRFLENSRGMFVEFEARRPLEATTLSYIKISASSCGEILSMYIQWSKLWHANLNRECFQWNLLGIELDICKMEDLQVIPFLEHYRKIPYDENLSQESKEKQRRFIMIELSLQLLDTESPDNTCSDIAESLKASGCPESEADFTRVTSELCHSWKSLEAISPARWYHGVDRILEKFENNQDDLLMKVLQLDPNEVPKPKFNIPYQKCFSVLYAWYKVHPRASTMSFLRDIYANGLRKRPITILEISGIEVLFLNIMRGISKYLKERTQTRVFLFLRKKSRVVYNVKQDSISLE